MGNSRREKSLPSGDIKKTLMEEIVFKTVITLTD